MASKNKSVKNTVTTTFCWCFPKYLANFKYLYNHQQRERTTLLLLLAATTTERQPGETNIIPLFTVRMCGNFQGFLCRSHQLFPSSPFLGVQQTLCSINCCRWVDAVETERWMWKHDSNIIFIILGFFYLAGQYLLNDRLVLVDNF